MRISSKLMSYSTIAGVVTSLSSLGQGISLIDINPDTVINGTGTFNLDVDGDFVNDFSFSLATGSWSNSFIMKAMGSNSMLTGNGYILNLNYGAVIGGSGNFITYGFLGFYSSLYTMGNFLGTSNTYIGLKLVINDTTKYGWIEISTNASLTQFTIHRYAYYDEPDWPILAAQYIVEGIGISENLRNNRSIIIYSYKNQVHISGSKGTTEIYNIQGQRVHQSKLTGKNTISLDRGIYLVRVTSEGRSITKKIYLI